MKKIFYNPKINLVIEDPTGEKTIEDMKILFPNIVTEDFINQEFNAETHIYKAEDGKIILTSLEEQNKKIQIEVEQEKKIQDEIRNIAIASLIEKGQL